MRFSRKDVSMKQVKMSDLVGALLKSEMISPESKIPCFYCKTLILPKEEHLWGDFPLCSKCNKRLEEQYGQEVLNGDKQNS